MQFIVEIDGTFNNSNPGAITDALINPELDNSYASVQNNCHKLRRVLSSSPLEYSRLLCTSGEERIQSGYLCGRFDDPGFRKISNYTTEAHADRLLSTQW